jgi:hypothetical protein
VRSPDPLFTDPLLLAALADDADPAAMQAAPVAALAADILAGADAKLLVVTIEPSPDGFDARLTLWSDALEAIADPALLPALEPLLPLLPSIETAAEMLAAAVAPRWPAHARPRSFGFVTDGTGLGFSSDDPCPLDRGWIARQTAGERHFTAILPFDPQGAWTLLTLPLKALGPLQ